jgi:prefoldin subunit 5
MSSVFEQKRHYEKEIEVLKKDLEVIEEEEHKIKSRLQEKTSVLEVVDKSLRE